VNAREHAARVEALERADRAAPLVEALEDERACWHMLVAAIRSLERLGAAEAAPAILKTLARAHDPDVREAAIDALGALRFARAARVLQRIADGDDAQLAARARRALLHLDAS
jgi:HEAT repeat protein